jgi:sugar phosphate isomerase/epimerase
MAVQLVSDEVHVATGEPWRHWFDDRSWDRIRELARAYGFEEVEMEPGDYVDQETAARLAGALEKSLADIPDHDAVGGRTEWIGDYHLPTADVTPTEWFSGAAKIYYKEFIRHCRAGGFTVEYDASRPGV